MNHNLFIVPTTHVQHFWHLAKDYLQKAIDTGNGEFTIDATDKHNFAFAINNSIAGAIYDMYRLPKYNLREAFLTTAIDTLEEASIQNWKFENISTENTDSYTFSDANHFYDPDDIDELEEYIDAEY